MSDDHRIAASALTDKMCDLLRPLVAADVWMRVPLFANTLPLAYHFRCAGASSETQAIRLVPWGAEAILDEAQREDTRRPLVFYCTRKQHASLSNTIARDGGLVLSTYVPVTRYVPRYVFARRTLQLQEALLRCGPTGVKLAPNEAAFIGGKAERCEVYSDTPEQAAALRQYVQDALTIDVQVVDPMNPAELVRPTRPHRALALYYVSAPSATVMRRDTSYVPLIIDDAAAALGTDIRDFETGVAVIARSTARLSEIVEQSVLSALRAYHEALYARADDKDAERCANSFIELTWLYNRLAAAQQRGDTFASENEYARCLKEHHAMPATAVVN